MPASADSRPSPMVDTMLQMVEELRQASLNQTRQRTQDQAPPATRVPAATDLTANNVVNMPLWAEDTRAVLHDLVRSALFTCGQKASRRQFKAEQIASVSNVTMIYTGEELRQRDHDVFQMLCHALRAKPLDSWLFFSGASLISALGWTNNGRSYRELEEGLRRLHACSLEVESRLRNGRKVRYSGHLVSEWVIAADQQDRLASGGADFAVRLNPRIAAIFAPGQFSRLDWNIRLKLSPLGKWLQGFYCTHAEPIALPVAQIYRLAGSAAKNLRQFRFDLKKAGEKLKELGGVADFRIDEHDRVVVIR